MVGDSGVSAKRRKTEEHALNTNVSILKSLNWAPARAIRELLLNCIDEDPEGDRRGD